MFCALPGWAIAAPLDGVLFLVGCWQAGTPAQQTIEIWTAPQGDTLFGLGYSVRDGKRLSHEYLRIEPGKKTGEPAPLVYVASPAGQATTRFALESSDAQSLIFSNPAHDFPKRIIYQRTTADTLLARAEAGDRGFDLQFSKIACEPLFTATPTHPQEPQ